MSRDELNHVAIAIENSYTALHFSVHHVGAMISWISLCLATSPRLSLCTRHVSWDFTSRGTSHLVAFHSTSCGTSRLVYVNQDSHGKFSNFTYEYLHVITRGLSRVCEVIVEHTVYKWHMQPIIDETNMVHIQTKLDFYITHYSTNHTTLFCSHDHL